MTEKEYQIACNVGLIYPKDSVPIEPLTDIEQRIFLAAMRREKKVCKKIDDEWQDTRPYEDSLVSVCQEIERKVKKVLWT